MKPSPVTGCPCGLPAPYADCCGKHHHEVEATPAPTPAALMRSRYCAYVLGLNDYLIATWHPRFRPDRVDPAPAELRWLGLEVRREVQLDADHADVEFVARSKLGGRAQRLHEVSHFVRENGRWYYLDGELR